MYTICSLVFSSCHCTLPRIWWHLLPKEATMGGGEKTTAASLCPLARQAATAEEAAREWKVLWGGTSESRETYGFLWPHATLPLEIENSHLSIPYTKPGCEFAILVCCFGGTYKYNSKFYASINFGSLMTGTTVENHNNMVIPGISSSAASLLVRLMDLS